MTVNLISLFFASVFAGIVIWLIVEAIDDYRKAPGDGLLSAFRGSATMLWGKIIAISSAVLGVVEQCSDAFNMPEVTAAVRAYVPPEAIPATFLVFALISMAARSRTLGKR